MSVEPRPTDLITKENLLVGIPFVLFERKLASGAFDTPRNLGIIDSAELQKVVEVLQLRNRQSGLSVLEREVVGRLEPSLALQLFNFEPANMQLFLSSKDLTTVAASTVVVTDDEVTVPPNFPNQFASLDNRNLTTEPLTDLDVKTITLENVGLGQGGTFGETQGDFALDFPILVIGDVTLYQETPSGGSPTNRTGDLVAGAAPLAGQIGIIVGASATSGEITYPAGEAPALNVKIEATYTPSFTFTNGTDYLLDPFDGRIRFLNTNQVRVGEVLLADYSYSQPDEEQLKPFTQSAFEGRATIKQLTDVGINFIWDVPSVSIRVNDDPFAFNADDFATASLTMNLLSVGGATPFGTFRQFPESPAAC